MHSHQRLASRASSWSARLVLLRRPAAQQRRVAVRGSDDEAAPAAVTGSLFELTKDNFWCAWGLPQRWGTGAEPDTDIRFWRQLPAGSSSGAMHACPQTSTQHTFTVKQQARGLVACPFMRTASWALGFSSRLPALLSPWVHVSAQGVPQGGRAEGQAGGD